ncbi:uncharacterized protein B0P05DRAFT_636303 [Gilbertella persicaria]|uniref:uncharacterized protein n=1 Tax=Gilbertella persicaria TaxID=101096 RepID=UPI002220B9E9|nr:uncharacterized protein B0P05DRAFT_636303 [Gilbertella persicaria]KAI8084144.1 hypothetical protein B0P05DRAFT_636303 [Gilbertella persicaria]
MNNYGSNEQQEKALEEFRNAWRQEVESKQGHDPHAEAPEQQQQQQEEASIAALIEQTESLAVDQPEPITAMDHYVLAVDNERQGKLGKALDSYRRAFKLDPDIDYAYKKHYQKEILPKIQATQDQPSTEDFKHMMPLNKEYVAPPPTSKDPLTDLIEQFLNEDLTYIPRLDYKPVSIAKLPSEIMLNVLKILALHSVSSISYFATVCKKFFLYTRDPSIWQYAAVRVFRQPSMTLEESRQECLKYVNTFDGNWMRMFIDRPRIRYDGVYISICHYIRPGTSETAWNKPIHFVTYYRYLRFFPDGRILKHVTTDEPAHVVKQLQLGYNKKQCFHGRFRMDFDDHITIVMKDYTIPRELFHLSLKIKTTHRGKHNRLNWDHYASSSIGVNRDDHVYDLKLLKHYIFSPVRSYKVHYPDEMERIVVDLNDPLTFL